MIPGSIAARLVFLLASIAFFYYSVWLLLLVSLVTCLLEACTQIFVLAHVCTARDIPT